MKLVIPVYESALVRDEAGHVLCHVCGCAMQAWTPCEGATWYECGCGEVVLAVKGVTE